MKTKLIALSAVLLATLLPAAIHSRPKPLHRPVAQHPRGEVRAEPAVGWPDVPMRLQSADRTRREARVQLPALRPTPRKTHERILDVPVRFTVRNVNDSKVPCTTDGATYQIHGRIIAPASALASASPTATLYLHASTIGSELWRFRDIDGYDYVTAIAQLGHTSVIIDQLGYGKSDKPPGRSICIGGNASVAHQVIQALRNGDYVMQGRLTPTRFVRVAIAGMSLGSFTAQVEAYSYGDVDAVLPMASDDGIFQAPAGAVVRSTVENCESPSGSAPNGYFFVWPTPQEEADAVFSNAEPDTIGAFTARVVRESCAVVESAVQAIASDGVYCPTIKVPVLIVHGDADKIVNPGPTSLQLMRFAGSSDAQLMTVHNAGHFLTLERTRSELIEGVAAWLSTHGL